MRNPRAISRAPVSVADPQAGLTAVALGDVLACHSGFPLGEFISNIHSWGQYLP